MLIHQVDNKHWERSVMDQRPVTMSGAERHVSDPPVEFVAHLIGRMWTDINPLKSSPS